MRLEPLHALPTLPAPAAQTGLVHLRSLCNRAPPLLAPLALRPRAGGPLSARTSAENARTEGRDSKARHTGKRSGLAPWGVNTDDDASTDALAPLQTRVLARLARGSQGLAAERRGSLSTTDALCRHSSLGHRTASIAPSGGLTDADCGTAPSGPAHASWSPFSAIAPFRRGPSPQDAPGSACAGNEEPLPMGPPSAQRCSRGKRPAACDMATRPPRVQSASGECPASSSVSAANLWDTAHLPADIQCPNGNDEPSGGACVEKRAESRRGARPRDHVRLVSAGWSVSKSGVAAV
jgi:hypothetical protein